MACVEQVMHVSLKSPKATLDGVPVMVFGRGMNASVAAAPSELFSDNVPLLTNWVLGAFVLNVMVVALALAGN